MLQDGDPPLHESTVNDSVAVDHSAICGDDDLPCSGSGRIGLRLFSVRAKRSPQTARLVPRVFPASQSR
jgi:hypothetical protein